MNRVSVWDMTHTEKAVPVFGFGFGLGFGNRGPEEIVITAATRPSASVWIASASMDDGGRVEKEEG